MNSIVKLMVPHTMVMNLNEEQRKRSSKLTSSFLLGREQLLSIIVTSSVCSQSFLLNRAIRLKDCLKTSIPSFIVNSGVYSTSLKAKIATRLGMNIKKPIMYFQLTIRYESKEIIEIPKEKASWMAIIIRSRVCPSTNSLKKLQCRVMAALAPNPSRKLPIPTMYKLTENIITTCPAIHTNHDINSPFFLPKLSPICDITTYPNSEPTQLSDCNMEDIHSFEQTIITPQSKAIDRGKGCFMWFNQNCQSSQLQTKSQQVSQSAISALEHVKSGTIQKKLREKRIIAAIIHFRANTRKIAYWQRDSPPTFSSSIQILFYMFCSMQYVQSPIEVRQYQNQFNASCRLLYTALRWPSIFSIYSQQTSRSLLYYFSCCLQYRNYWPVSRRRSEMV